MSKLGIAIRGTLAAGAIGIGVYGVQETHVADYEKSQKDKAAATVAVEEAQYNNVRVRNALGERCLSHMTVYLPGGELYTDPDATEAVAVPDLKDAGVCGDTDTEIRTAYRRSVKADTHLSETKEQLVASKDTLTARKQGKETWAEGDTAILAGAAIWLIAGVFCECLIHSDEF